MHFFFVDSAFEMIYCIIQWKDVTHTLHWEYTINKFQCEKDSIADFYDAVAQVVSKGDENVWSYVNAYKDSTFAIFFQYFPTFDKSILVGKLKLPIQFSERLLSTYYLLINVLVIFLAICFLRELTMNQKTSFYKLLF